MQTVTNIKERFGFIRNNSKQVTQFLLALLFLSLGAWFFKHKQAELGQIRQVLLSSRIQYIILGLGITLVYIVLQGLMYKLAFASVKRKVSLLLTVQLFLKRNFISVFIPAGGITSLAFFTEDIEKEENSKSGIHFASSIYAFVGIFSVVIIAVPVFIYALFKGISGVGEILALASMVAVLTLAFLTFLSVKKKRGIYRFLIRKFPSTEVFFEELSSNPVEIKYLIPTLLVSLVIDITCIILLYTAMLALGFKASVLFALLGYLTAVVSLFISPFMRGLGAVEISLTFILTRFGYSSLEAVAITILYRFFEFWLPLLSGALTFVYKINKLLMRTLPALLIFTLGIINIVSSITPGITERIRLLEDFLPVSAITASNYFVFMAGAFLLLTAIYMLKGLRNAWRIAVFLSVISLIGHVTKAIDYEEATIAFFVLLTLVFSRKQYYVKSNPRIFSTGIWTALLAVVAVLIYGMVGFYFLDRKHFGTDFNIWQSFYNSLRYLILIGNNNLTPVTRFGKDFILTINMSGFLSLIFLFYTILRPYIFKESAKSEEFIRAKEMVVKFGNSSMDYFKTYDDKSIYIPEGLEAFISYRTAGSVAVVLENPVSENEEVMKDSIKLFDKFCYENGLRNIYYRVPEESLRIYRELRKKVLFIGQEAIVDLKTFTLEGGKNKPLRNAINKIIDEGYHSTIHTPPIKDGLLQKLKYVSDEWLDSTDRKEIVFSQGMFIWKELKEHTIITVENHEEKVIAFLNIIPDYVKGEGTYDLIRKTSDAPHGVLDFIMIELFKYLRSQGYSYVNLGFAPMSGLNDPHNFQERSMKFAYEKIRSFSHYKGLRFYKEKFFPAWYNKYLIYSDDYDLLQIPAVLTKVIKPLHE